MKKDKLTLIEQLKRKSLGILTPLNGIILALVVPLYGIFISSLSHKVMAKNLLLHTTYYLVMALVLLWIWSLVKLVCAEKLDWKKILSVYGPGLLAAFILTLIIAVSVKPGLRVLSDETNMASVAHSMLYKKTVENVTQGYYYYGNFQPEAGGNPIIEKRPFLLPFAVQTLHTVLGYDIRNVYRANLLFAFLIFFCVYLFLTRYLERLWVFTGMVCAAAQPLVSQCATSGGYDLSGAFCVIVSLVTLRHWLEKPKAAHRFEFLVFCLLVLAQSRPESLIFTAGLALLLLSLGYLKIELIAAKFWLLVTGPLLIVPVIWQRLLIVDQYENPQGVVPFSFEHFRTNSFNFFLTLGRFDAYLPYATILNILGFCAIACASLLLIFSGDTRRKFLRNRPARDFSLAVFLVLAAHWTVYASYYFGHATHPSTARYFVLTCIVLSMAAVAFLRWFSEGRNASVYFIIACALFVLYHPITIEGRFSNTQTLPRQYEYVIGFLEKNASKHSLIITDRPGQYVVREYGAIDFANANMNTQKVLEGFHRHLYQDIYVIQEIFYQGEIPNIFHTLSDQYKLETVECLQNTAYVYTRISKVVNVPDPERIRKPGTDPTSFPGSDIVPTGPPNKPA